MFFWEMTILGLWKYCTIVYILLFMASVLWRCWLVGKKGVQLVKNWAVGCWCGYLSVARCRLAYGPGGATATHCFSKIQIGFYYFGTSSHLLQWLRGLGLSELQCSEPGWLVRQGVGSFPTPASMSSRFLHAMRLNSRAGIEGSPVSSLSCDRPSHPDRGRLVCGESCRCG